MQRRLAGTVIVDGTDDESWPWSDEKVRKQYGIDMVLSDDQPAQVMDLPDVRWGGECRVEMHLTARATPTGAVLLEGTTALFEGDSEASDDKEDEKTVTFLVPKGGRPAHHRIQLRNVGAGGGDHAEISISVTNAFFEPE